MVGSPGGGYGAGAPIRKSGGGCLPWALGGCGLLVVIVVVIGVAGVMRIARDPNFRKAINSAASAPQCGQNLQSVRDGLEAYRNAHGGKYPPMLAALSPKYLTDPSLLVCGSQGGERMKTEYTPPKSDSSADAPIVSYVGGETTLLAGKMTRIGSIRLLRDGRIVSDQVQRMEIVPRGGRASQGKPEKSDDAE